MSNSLINFLLLLLLFVFCTQPFQIVRVSVDMYAHMTCSRIHPIGRLMHRKQHTNNNNQKHRKQKTKPVIKTLSEKCKNERNIVMIAHTILWSIDRVFFHLFVRIGRTLTKLQFEQIWFVSVCVCVSVYLYLFIVKMDNECM